MLIATQKDQSLPFEISGPVLFEYTDAAGTRLLEVYIPDLYATVILDMDECNIEVKRLN